MVKDYQFTFTTKHSAEEVFNSLLDIHFWWYGQFNETISGSSSRLQDEFVFEAGEGLHFTRQRLTQLVPYTKIVWTVVESKLSFLEHPGEWKDSQLVFELKSISDKQTTICFSHVGLNPGIACYETCSSAWTSYMQALEKKLN